MPKRIVSVAAAGVAARLGLACEKNDHAYTRQLLAAKSAELAALKEQLGRGLDRFRSTTWTPAANLDERSN